MRKFTLLFLMLLTVLILAACGEDEAEATEENEAQGAESGELESVDLILAADGTPMYYAYIARENGYFEEEGLDVTLQPGKGGTYVIQQVGAETIDVGITAISALLPAWDKGIDIQSVYQVNVTNLFDFMVPKGSDIQDATELKGKVIGVTDIGGGEVPMVRSILASYGIDADQEVTLRAIGSEAPSILQAFDNGDIDAYIGGAHDLISLYARGFESESLIPEEFLTLPSTAIITNGKTAEENPELVEKISRAVARATDFSINNPDEAYDTMKEALPEEYEDEEVSRLFLETFIGLSTPIEPEKGYGYIYMDAWENLVEQFSVGENPVVTNEIDLDKYLNSDFLEAANDFEK